MKTWVFRFSGWRFRCQNDRGSPGEGSAVAVQLVRGCKYSAIGTLTYVEGGNILALEFFTNKGEVDYFCRAYINAIIPSISSL